VVYRLFPYTFEGKSSTWYFSQQPQSITSWNQFEIAFIEKFGDGKTLEVLVMELSNMKMYKKEKIKDFNVRFMALKKKSLKIPCLLKTLSLLIMSKPYLLILPCG
jgi:hypothetical protein